MIGGNELAGERTKKKEKKRKKNCEIERMDGWSMREEPARMEMVLEVIDKRRNVLRCPHNQ